MIDIFNKAKEFIGLGPEDEAIEPPIQKSESISLDYSSQRKKTDKKSSSDLEISIFEPKAYENSIEISARLRSGHPVIINIKYLDTNEGTRLIDFISGTAFAIDGHMMKISDTIFLLTPSNVSIANFTSDPQSEAQNKDNLFKPRF